MKDTQRTRQSSETTPAEFATVEQTDPSEIITSNNCNFNIDSKNGVVLFLPAQGLYGKLGTDAQRLDAFN